MYISTVLAACLLLVVSALCDLDVVFSEQTVAKQLTLYQNGSALVLEDHTVSVEAGLTELVLRLQSDQLQSESLLVFSA
ncbi:hypothetical protein KIPB_010548, partial [Kipferlia bialata]|eukprot:g10548.t1